MKHATADDLLRLGPLLQRLRSLTGLVERKPGIFYRKGSAFLHFHVDGASLSADAKLDGAGFSRMPVDSEAQQRALLDAVQAVLQVI